MRVDSLHFRMLLALFSAFVGLVVLVLALRARSRGEASGPVRFTLASAAFAIAALEALGDLAPVVGYSILCLSVASFFLADLLLDERTRRRRVALLTPRPATELIPTLWIAMTLLSTSALVPYLLGGVAVAPALITAGCAIAMAAIAFRIASAPTQLIGEDPQAERLRDRLFRSRQTGIVCVVAVGTLFAFVTFANETSPTLGGLGRAIYLATTMVWVGLAAWQFWYVRRISIAATPSSS
ncbi:MAG: hypothetical protein PXZ07_04950 [Candidatus Eremiobacteraeota bacterium]|nr:hypothetical protein [Candidatus Eremiobacteraeota bacterium]